MYNDSYDNTTNIITSAMKDITTYEVISICMMASTIIFIFCGVGVCWWQLKVAFANSM